jgi:hypothetical protein
MPRSGPRRRWFALAALALAWAAPGPAVAADGAVAVYTGVEPSAMASADAASLLARLVPPVSLVAPPAPLDALLLPGVLEASGSATAIRCEDDPTTPTEYRDALGAIDRSLDEVLLDDADRWLAEAARRRPCLVETIGRSDLASEPFMAGILAFYRGDLTATRAAFRLALAVDPELAWDPDYPPTAQQEFASALMEVLRSPPVAVELRLSADRIISIDGEIVEGAADRVELRPGKHLLQSSRTDGETTSIDLRVESGQTLTVFDHSVLGGAIEDGPLTLLLAGKARDAGASAGYLVSLGAGPRIWRVATDGSALEEIESPVGTVTPPDVTTTRARVHPLGPVLTAIGAALAVGGGVLAGVERKEALALHGALEAWDAADGSPQTTLDSFERHRSASYAGWGLLAGGGACVAIGIPLTLKLRRPVEVTAALSTGWPQVRGEWGFRLSFRPLGGPR